MTPIRISLQIKSFVSGIRAFFNAYKKRVIAAGGYIEGEQCAIDKLKNPLLNSASFVLIPSGIEEDIVFAQKPTNGTGDLTFTRASDATRTNSAGVIERTPWNLQSNSEMFTLSNWTKSSTTIVANTITAPNGTLTADTLRSTVNGTSIRYRLYGDVNVVSGVTYTGSYYLKKANHRWIQIIAPNSFNTDAWANFDLEAGVIGNKGTGVVATIQSVGDGWYRCSVTGTASATASDTNFNLVLTNNTNSARYPAYISTTAVDVCYVWGAQLVEGTDAKPYFATTNRQDVPRLDYRNADGSLNSCPRLLLEPQRTNSIRNSTMVGAVAGSPGTLPTNWSNLVTAGLTRTIVGTGTENGLPYVDIRFNGTANALSTRIDFEGSTNIAALTAQVWTNSIYSKIVSQPNPAVSYALQMLERTSGGGFVTDGSQIFTPTTSLQRFAFTRTLNGGATVANVQPCITINLTNGATYDFTIRIAAPQMELGASATTFIPTTTAAVTRLVDVFSRNNLFTNNIVTSSGGTWFLDLSSNLALVRDSTTSFFLGDSSSGTVGNSINIRNNYTTARRLSINKSVSGSLTELYVTLTDNVKMAIKWNGTTADVFVNGSKVVAATAFTATALQILGGNGIDVPKFINQSALFPVPLTDAQCIQLTT
jgi:hypothetical protein